MPVREAEGAGDGRTHPSGDDIPEDVWRAISARSRDFICLFRSDGTILYTNERITEFLGWPNGDMNGTNVAGPPPRPLEQYAVKLRGDKIVIDRNA